MSVNKLWVRCVELREIHFDTGKEELTGVGTEFLQQDRKMKKEKWLEAKQGRLVSFFGPRIPSPFYCKETGVLLLLIKLRRIRLFLITSLSIDIVLAQGNSFTFHGLIACLTKSTTYYLPPLEEYSTAITPGNDKTSRCVAVKPKVRSVFMNGCLPGGCFGRKTGGGKGIHRIELPCYRGLFLFISGKL